MGSYEFEGCYISCHYLRENTFNKSYFDSKMKKCKKRVKGFMCYFREKDSAVFGLVTIKLEDCLLCDKSTVQFQGPSIVSFQIRGMN